MTMKPFADDSASNSIGDLTAENGKVAVTISGSLELTRDKVGLKRAKAFKALADSVVSELEAADDLPDKVEVPKAATTGEVANPFA